MWQSRLLPRPMVMFGLIGGPLSLLAGIGVLLGAWESTSGLPVALTAPEAIWEFSLCLAARQRLQAVADPHRRAGHPGTGKLEVTRSDTCAELANDQRLTLLGARPALMRMIRPGYAPGRGEDEGDRS
jgi:hypothetical protein